MNTTTRLAGFGVALVAILGVGAGVGAAIGPDDPTSEAEAPAPIGQGVVAAADGYRLIPASTALDPDGGTFEFAVRDQNDPRRRSVHPHPRQAAPPHRREPRAHHLPPRPPPPRRRRDLVHRPPRA